MTGEWGSLRPQISWWLRETSRLQEWQVDGRERDAGQVVGAERSKVLQGAFQKNRRMDGPQSEGFVIVPAAPANGMRQGFSAGKQSFSIQRNSRLRGKLSFRGTIQQPTCMARRGIDCDCRLSLGTQVPKEASEGSAKVYRRCEFLFGGQSLAVYPSFSGTVRERNKRPERGEGSRRDRMQSRLRGEVPRQAIEGRRMCGDGPR